MKKFTKLFLSCAAVAAVTAAVATSAMAADKTLTASYSVAEGASVGTVTITCASEDEAKTLLILKPGADKTAIKADDILQIDQAGTIATATVPVLDEEADKGTYIVLMGGTSGDIYEGKFKIGQGEILMGDVNFDTFVDLSDTTLVIDHFISPTTNGLTGDALIAGEVNEEDPIDLSDATCIINYFISPNGTDHGVAGEVK